MSRICKLLQHLDQILARSSTDISQGVTLKNSMDFRHIEIGRPLCVGGGVRGAKAPR